MTTDDDLLVRLLVAGDAPGVDRALAEPGAVHTPVALLVGALAGREVADRMASAARLARCTRDRQLVAITAAHLSGDGDRVADLVRDHLVDHPDSVLAAWVASLRTTRSTPTTRTAPQE